MFTFPLPLLPCALLLTGRICDRDVIVEFVVCILPRIYIFLDMETMSFSKLAAIMNWHDFAVIFAIFAKVCRVFCHFCRDFLLSLVVTSRYRPSVIIFRLDY